MNWKNIWILEKYFPGNIISKYEKETIALWRPHYHKLTRVYLLSEIWKDRLNYQENYSLNNWQRYCYLFKCSICVVLGLQQSDKFYHERWRYHIDHINEAPEWYDDIESVAFLNHTNHPGNPNCPAGSDWEELAVGYGVFKNWYYRVFSNGSC